MKVPTLRTPQALAGAGLIPADGINNARAVADRYAVAVPATVAALIERGNPDDPLARQYLPDARELVGASDDLTDPIGDARHSPVAGIVHRYTDRALFKIVHTCPVYCRFCFRREMVGPGREPNLSRTQIERAVAYIAGHPEIREVIFTGGDPFILTPQRIRALTDTIDAISHVRRIRWHTRVPVVEPQRIDASYAKALRPHRASLAIAIHANHPREFTAQAGIALDHLKQAGAQLLSQSVLLHGVNDNVETLSALLQAFRSHGIEPYYLHHADRAPGTAHFRTTIHDGVALMQQLRKRDPSARLPTYVLDIPGGYSKVDLMGDGADAQADGLWRLRDDNGRWHDYSDRK